MGLGVSGGIPWRGGTASLVLCVVALAPVARAQEAPIETDRDKALYAIGTFLGKQLLGLDLGPAEFERVAAGVRDAALARPVLASTFEFQEEIEALQAERRERALQRDRTLSREFLAASAARPGALRTPSGLVFEELAVGSGPMPGPTDRVRVHYEGRLRDGTLFDSTRVRRAAAVFPLDSVISCWTEGLQRMQAGGQARITCPPELGYGAPGHPPGVPANAPLAFDVHLLEVIGPD